MSSPSEALSLPGAQLEAKRMPGHWLLARLGKRVLRPGGLELTRKMLDGLAIGPGADVVEFAPGLGTTTRLVLARAPSSYVGIERDEAAAKVTARVLRPGRDQVRQGVAARTGLEPEVASVVFGEAMLTMQTDEQKAAIVREAHRVLRAGGRYGIHELALTPDALPEGDRTEIQRALSESIHVGARPLTVSDWRALLEANGFEVTSCATAPMLLLEVRRVIADEGLFGALRIAWNLLKDAEARRRVLGMRSVFRRYASRMCGVTLVARRRDEAKEQAGPSATAPAGG